MRLSLSALLSLAANQLQSTSNDLLFSLTKSLSIGNSSSINKNSSVSDFALNGGFELIMYDGYKINMYQEDGKTDWTVKALPSYDSKDKDSVFYNKLGSYNRYPFCLMGTDMCLSMGQDPKQKNQYLLIGTSYQSPTQPPLNFIVTQSGQLLQTLYTVDMYNTQHQYCRYSPNSNNNYVYLPRTTGAYPNCFQYTLDIKY